MSANYRRLISYIYAYEGGEKGRNVGFAKLETRNGQCRIQVSVRKIYMGSQDIGVYLLSGSREILIGRIFLRNGAGEFRASVAVDNIAGSDQSMDQCYGLTIHSMDDSWQSYTTIWEDAVAHAAEVELSEAVSELVEAKKMQQIPECIIPGPELLPQPEPQPVPLPQPELPQEEPSPQLEPQPELPPQPQPESQPEMPVPEPQPEIPGPEPQPECPVPEPQPECPVPELQPECPVPELQPEIPQPEISSQPASLEMLHAQEPAEDMEAAKLWNYLVRSYPKIQAFDYAGGCEILTIKPQDIGLLPREVWTYGNNSFLLHGYYNHRHLILVRLNHPNGAARFLLGVPGYYYNNEKYMAAMFGFPNFILSKMQPSEDGRFGYWYVDVRLGNQ